MDYERQFKARFLTLFCLVGILNAFAISQIYFLETKKALIERATSQLISVRELFEDLHSGQEYETINKALKMKAGMGSSGEMYLVDTSLRISSSSRFGPQWLNKLAVNEAAINSTKGKKGVAVLKDYRGIDVISAYGPIVYDNKTYGLLCEMDLSEVLAPLQETKKKIIFVCAILILVTFLLSLFFSSKMINFLRRMRDEINTLHEDKNQETNRTSLRIIVAQEHERAKISRDIHDGIGQLITSLKWQLSLKENTDDLVEICDKALSEVRSISQNVVPSVLADFGIFVALDEMFESLKKLPEPKIELSISDDVRDVHLKPSFEINLYRIIQELIQNGLKHSQSKNILIKLELLNSTLQIIYQDDGKGIDATAFSPKSLDYRVKLFTGKMVTQESRPGLHILFNFKLTEITNENIHS